MCLIVYDYVALKDEDRYNILQKLTPKMIKQLAMFLAP